jgi:chorismate mutase/prephenate dehydratase
MSDTPSDLEDLRRRIDGIDNRLQDLLIERIEIVAQIGARKRTTGGVAAHQPGREAEMIRRLVSRNHGGLPPATLVRMWRELLAATTRLQGVFAIAVYAPPEAQGFWDLARDHYGSQAQMLAYRTTGQVIHAVTEGQAAVGVLPMPQEGDPDPWWRHLLSADGNAPHVIARLPFGGRGNIRADGDALAIGRGVEQPTGRDRTLLVTENAADISRGRMFSMLAGLGIDCTFLASCEHAEGANTLIEIDGFVPVSDPRLDRLCTQLGPALHRLLRFGGYAVPLSAAELGLAKASAPAAGLVPAGGLAVTSAAKG